jgi:integrative and conjugative element protein (TIGR02256 family)
LFALQGIQLRLVFRVSSDQRIVFTDKAVEQMTAYRQQKWWQGEAGGVLLGRHLLETPDLVVDEVTVPQKEDRRGRLSFFRSKQHGVVARARWVSESETLAYLGLWHTHPESDPTPSSVDRRDWDNAVAGDVFEGDRLFFPIVGTRRIRVWTKRRGSGIEELSSEGDADA